MKKIKVSSVAVLFFISFIYMKSSLAQVSQFLIPQSSFQDVINWKVGDYTVYNLSMGFLGSGTVRKSVTKDEGDSLWLTVEAKLDFGSQNAEIQIRKKDGKILKIIVDGQEQPNNEHKIVIVEKRPEEVKVPAWDQPFKTIFLKVKDETDNAEVDSWINPNTFPPEIQPKTPIDGMVKSIVNKGFLTMSTELTEYGFAGETKSPNINNPPPFEVPEI